MDEYENAPAFVGPELAALVLAAEQERAGRPQLEAWCRQKVERSGWQLTRVEALGAVFLNHGSLGWTTERVFRALGVELRKVVL